MLRIAVVFLMVLYGPAFGADLELQPKSRHSPQQSPQPPSQASPPQEPAPAPQAPAPSRSNEPTQLRSNESAPQKPAVTDEMKLVPPPQADSPANPDSWWQKIVREAPNCKSFSDGCRTCSPSFACSGLPIACQPKEFTCVDPKPSDDKASDKKP